MSNIDKQALREIAAAAVGAHERLSVMPPDDIFDISLAEGTQLDADITALNALNSAANPTTVLALLASLEAAEKRIAELEAREIRLPERSSMLHRTDFHDDYQTVMAYKVSEVIDAIRATGIRIKGE
ncbi:ead/Ea22-like family protein [Escherichia coli]|uniref:ead/Ea22-like family protein n=1 Tax=Escherichia coli TaxID=562 RepID=UPI003A98521A